MREAVSYLSYCAGKVSVTKLGLLEKAWPHEATLTGRCGEAQGEAMYLRVGIYVQCL